jgi:hypothetical protein
LLSLYVVLTVIGSGGTITGLHIDFKYLSHGSQSIAGKYQVEPQIIFRNEDLDACILKLTTDPTKAFPPPFQELALIYGQEELYVIGHSDANPKKIDAGCMTLPLTPQQVDKLKNWSSSQLYPSGYDGIDNPHRILFNTDMEPGASGSPAIAIRAGRPAVVAMLVCGYPKFYHGLHKGGKDNVPLERTFEQGTTMNAVLQEMRRDHSLNAVRFDIFGQ